jgi:hypothetical protein
MPYVFDAGDIIHFHGRLYETGFEQPRGKRVPLIPVVNPARKGWSQTGPRLWASRTEVEAGALCYESVRATPPKKREQYRE